MNTILLMAEVDNYLFWKANTKENGYLPELGAIETNSLNLSEEVVTRLNKWGDFYSDHHNLLISEEIEFRFNQMGLILFTLVSRELAGKYNVVYYDEVLNKVIDEDYVKSLRESKGSGKHLRSLEDTLSDYSITIYKKEE